MVGGCFLFSWHMCAQKKQRKQRKIGPTIAGGILSSEVAIHHSHDSHGRTTINYVPKVTYEYQG